MTNSNELTTAPKLKLEPTQWIYDTGGTLGIYRVNGYSDGSKVLSSPGDQKDAHVSTIEECERLIEKDVRFRLNSITFTISDMAKQDKGDTEPQAKIFPELTEAAEELRQTIKQASEHTLVFLKPVKWKCDVGCFGWYEVERVAKEGEAVQYVVSPVTGVNTFPKLEEAENKIARVVAEKMKQATKELLVFTKQMGGK